MIPKQPSAMQKTGQVIKTISKKAAQGVITAGKVTGQVFSPIY